MDLKDRLDLLALLARPVQRAPLALASLAWLVLPATWGPLAPQALQVARQAPQALRAPLVIQE